MSATVIVSNQCASRNASASASATRPQSIRASTPMAMLQSRPPSTLIARRSALPPLRGPREPMNKRALSLTVRAKDSNDSEEKGEDTKTQEMIKVLQGQGVKANTAKEILRSWKEVGIESSDDLRKLLVQRSRTATSALGLQVLIDAFVCSTALAAAQNFGAAEGWPFFILAGLSYGATTYYAANTIFGAISVGLLLTSSSKYGTDADALLSAVQQLAGEDTKVGLVKKAKQAINMVKVIQSLNDAANLMKENMPPATTLENLSAYLTLENAEKRFGFEPSKFNISEHQAMDIAVKFARIDLNDDGIIEKMEMSKLFETLEMQMTGDETEAALKVLDTNNSGVVEFEEFVNWYFNRIPEQQTASSAAE